MTAPKPLAPALAVFGTASDVGKSMIAAGLCRLLSDAGYRTAPFKAQNMSNNSAVTREGGEMGRAQVVQAWAARVEPHVDMNPVLLKPASEDGSQVVLLGKPWKSQNARSYFAQTQSLKEVAFAALARLRGEYDCVVLEGAGSCAEVNLRAREFVNFPAAHAADAPVILVADIERGGVFAQIVGSLEVMPEEDRARVVGFVINRFRGDQSLFDDGVRYLEEKTQRPVFGVVPFVHNLDVDSEDSLRLDAPLDPASFFKPHAALRIAVLALPRISNSTDFDALLGLENLEVHYLRRPRSLAPYDVVIIPGSKSVRGDLDWMRQVGWLELLSAYRAQGGRVAGICGGYQMLGETISDPHGVEGAAGSSEGLGFLPVSTTLEERKVLGNVVGKWKAYGAAVQGYEIHMGRTVRVEPASIADDDYCAAVVELSLAPGHREQEAASPARETTSDGLSRRDGRVWGTYLHGLFDSPAFLEAWLKELCPEQADRFRGLIQERATKRENSLAVWADHLRQHLDLAKLTHKVGLKFE